MFFVGLDLAVARASACAVLHATMECSFGWWDYREDGTPATMSERIDDDLLSRQPGTRSGGSFAGQVCREWGHLARAHVAPYEGRAARRPEQC